MLRRVLTFALIAALTALPATIIAQGRLSLGSITGRAVDATGRGIGAQRIELLQGTDIVTVGTTSASGDWSFQDVKPGEYVVRVVVRSRIAGIRVHVIGGQAADGMLIVVPTASVSPQLGTLASLLTLVPTAATAVAATATAQAIQTETTQLNERILTDILEDLTPAERVTFAQAVLTAIGEAGNSSSPFAQYQQQFQQIRDSGGTTIPTFPPPVPVS